MVIDFSAYPLGTKVILQNLNDADVSGRVANEIMRFDVLRSEEDDSVVPGRLSDVPTIPAEAAVRTRHIVLAGRPVLRFPPVAHWTINGKNFDADRAIAAPRHGDVEIWHIENRKLCGSGSSRGARALDAMRAKA